MVKIRDLPKAKYLPCDRGHMVIGMAVLLCVDLLLGSAGAWAQSGSDSEQRLITLTLRGGVFDKTLAAMLTSLTRDGLIEMRPMSDPAAKTPGELFAKAASLSSVGQLPGGGITQPIDEFLCSINPHVCTSKGRWLYRLSKGKTSHTSSCSDALMPFEICSPTMEIEKGLTLLLVDYNPKVENERKLAEIVVDQFGGCAAFDPKCKRLIEDLNKSTFKILGSRVFDESSTPKLLIPSTSYQVVLRGTSELQYYEWEVAVRASYLRTIWALATDPNIPDPKQKILLQVRSPEWSQNWNPLSDPEDALNEKALESVHYQPAEQAGETKVVGFLFEGNAEVHREHCEFADAPRKNAGDPCESTHIANTAATTANNHATQVAGIYTAKQNQWGLSGVDAGTELRMFRINRTSLDPFSDNFISLAQDFPSDPPFVLNFSFHHPNALDFRSLLALAPGSNFLVIAAAGNDGDIITSAFQCGIFPACLSTAGDRDPPPQNLLSVVALNEQGDSVLGVDDCPNTPSNSGSVFDVAAPGVFLSAANLGNGAINSLARFCGTSAAAPVVSGLASAIIRKARQLGRQPSAVAVRERIAATADIGDTSLGEAVRFGRVHFKRALSHIDKDWILIRCDEEEGCPLLENLRDKKSITFELTRGATVTSLPLSDIRRLKRVDPFDNSGPIAFDAVFRLDGRLVNERITLPADIPLKRNPNKYKTQSIFDFVSCSFSPECEGQ
jgi:hypothetical protein